MFVSNGQCSKGRKSEPSVSSSSFRALWFRQPHQYTAPFDCYLPDSLWWLLSLHLSLFFLCGWHLIQFLPLTAVLAESKPVFLYMFPTGRKSTDTYATWSRMPLKPLSCSFPNASEVIPIMWLHLEGISWLTLCSLSKVESALRLPKCCGLSSVAHWIDHAAVVHSLFLDCQATETRNVLLVKLVGPEILKWLLNAVTHLGRAQQTPEQPSQPSGVSQHLAVFTSSTTDCPSFTTWNVTSTGGYQI